MGNPRFDYLLHGQTGAVASVDLAGGLTRLRGGIETDEASTVTPSGRAVAICHDLFDVYELRAEGISRVDDLTLWANCLTFVAYCRSGGTFAFAFDSAKAASTTLSAQAAKGASTLSVVSAAGFAVDDRIVLEHLTDPRIWQVTRAFAVSSSILISPSTQAIFPLGSYVRHFEYIPKARVLEPVGRNVSFHERDAGAGVHLWDLEVTFRSLRA